MTECTGGISTGGIRTTSECEWPGTVMAHRVRLPYVSVLTHPSSLLTFSFFTTSDRFVLPGARDVLSQVNIYIYGTDTTVFFHYSVDIFGSVQFVTWQATIPLGRMSCAQT
jgi:hypothetical protein